MRDDGDCEVLQRSHLRQRMLLRLRPSQPQSGYNTRCHVLGSGPRVLSGGVTRQGVVPTDLQSLVGLLSINSLSCALCPQGVPHGQRESGGVVLAVICWAPSAQRRCYRQGVVLTDFQSLVGCQSNFFLALSVSLALSLSLTHQDVPGIHYQSSSST